MELLFLERSIVPALWITSPKDAVMPLLLGMHPEPGADNNAGVRYLLLEQ